MRSFQMKLAVAFCAAAVLAPAPSRADEGEQIFRDACSACHDAKTRPLDKVRLTREKWKQTLDKMEGQGADIPGGKKREALLDYLERTHGVGISAPADDKK
jgi:mono/diheme cytochrome c family protein